MNWKDYSELQRLIGNIEGACVGIGNTDIESVITDACAAIDEILNRVFGTVLGIGELKNV